MAAMKLIVAIALIALVACASAHQHSNGARTKRATAPASMCSYITCAVPGGSCGASSGSLQLCVAGEHCSGTTCVADIALGGACNVNAVENECAAGRCVNTGNGAVCQYYQELMPGQSCEADSACLPSGASGSSCVAGTCRGRNNGDACTASYQCNAGSFCAANGQCAALGASGAACTSDAQCNSRLSCLSGQCSAHYTQSAGQVCASTMNCNSGLYCSAGKVCTPVSKVTTRSNTQCDVNVNATNACLADQACSCNGYKTANQKATCAPIIGTPTDMASIEQNAFACMDGCGGSDLSNANTVNCINTTCLAAYCTYFTRVSTSLYNDYPTCLLRRTAATSAQATLLASCVAYAPAPIPTQPPTPLSTSSANAVAASVSWILLVASAIFFFEL